MATSTGGPNITLPPDASNLGSHVTDTLTQADAAAAVRVQNLQWVHQARASQLARTAAALKAQYGADDAGVKSADAKVAAANAVSVRVAMVHQQMTTAAPDVAPDGWALHGRVFDASLAPVRGFTVFLVDDTKAYQQAYGFAYTDDTGYFLLNYGGGGHAAELFVEVTDQKARPAYLSTMAFQPVIGGAAYQNIVLPDQPIGEPPAAVRKVGVPKRDAKS